MRLFQTLLNLIFGDTVPEKHRDRVRVDQIDAAAKLAPFSTLVSGSVVVVIVVSCWKQGPLWYLIPFLAALEVTVVGTLFAVHRWRRTADRIANSRRAAVIGLTAATALGVIWATMPIVLFPLANPDNRLMIACTAAGLICTGVVVAPLIAAAEAFVSAIICGSFVGLYLTGDAFFAIIALLLLIYAVFIVTSIAYLHHIFMQKLFQQLQLEEQGEIIRLLLGDFDQSAANWLWETDAEGRLRNVSQRFAEVLNRRRTEAERMPFLQEIFKIQCNSDPFFADRQKLANCFAEQMFFRDVIVPVRVAEEDRWWSLTGKATFDQNGVFQGYRGVGSDISSVRAAEVRSAHQARHDFLTGLPNRVLFLEALRSACERSAALEQTFALLALDLDGFKSVNDKLGHASGDEVLRAVAGRLRGTIRDGDLVARMGGDEFMLLVPDATVEMAAGLARRLIGVLSAPVSIDSVGVFVGVSIGIALSPSAGEYPDDLLQHADLALYSAKNAGRGTYRFFEAELESNVKERRSLLRDLRQAKRHGELRVYFQPVVSAQTLAVRGFEALLRWDHPQRGLVLPGQIIPLAEEAGLIGEIGEWVLRDACAQAATWPSGLRVAVNVSASQLRDRGLVAQVASALAASGLPASRLELEITESVFMEAAIPTADVLRRIRDSGVRIALDDFGIGFSSLGYLRDLPVDKIKIDGTFVRNMGTDACSAAIVHMVIGLAASLGAATTAEGVETVEQFLPLRNQGCTEIQGFLFGRPMPAGSLASFLQSPKPIIVPDTSILAPSAAANALGV
jgi:diguanylate cyclase (GGDEF)-like protein